MMFLKLEKGCDKVLKEILKWVLMKKEVSKLCVNIIKDLHKRSNTNSINVCGKIEDFKARIGVYKGL